MESKRRVQKGTEFSRRPGCCSLSPSIEVLFRSAGSVGWSRERERREASPPDADRGVGLCRPPEGIPLRRPDSAEGGGLTTERTRSRRRLVQSNERQDERHAGPSCLCKLPGEAFRPCSRSLKKHGGPCSLGVHMVSLGRWSLRRRASASSRAISLQSINCLAIGTDL